MDYNNAPLVPMSSPDLSEAERQAVLSVVNTSALSMGPYITAFEDAFCKYTGLPHAIGVNSGTAGLHLCVLACDIQDHDLVITTPFSFVASSNVLLYERAIPVFVDVDAHTGNINPAFVEAAAADLAAGGRAARQRLPRRGSAQPGPLKAILAVDVFGQMADYDRLRQTANRYNLRLIQDSCESLGATYKERPSGTLGDMGVFAFYPNKQITTGEGGMIVTSDNNAATKMRALRNQGRAPGDTWLEHSYLGFNYRLDEMSAALGTVQMQRLESLLAARQRTAAWYSELLEGVTGIELPQLAPETTRASWFVYVIRLAQGTDRAALSARLAQKGIPVRPYFSAIHLHPYMVERFGYRPGDFPVTEDLSARGLALPFSGKMTYEQVETVCQALRAALQPDPHDD
ncbi:MAG: DegT/DnrJ/EryC1/StrS family aminotransferase [Anaerolineaceae bacterium]|nr:DegT/DnrJ/EryC1/StrS family aminotransferase [Anaerolineaceae bacterium]